ncbi:MAG: hypothetical protein LBU07_06045 [Coriobacteriales bacterium]|jgi:ribosome maturation factor RimP|nr:hypothetical protein [Coriobacteriales bacterium]
MNGSKLHMLLAALESAAEREGYELVDMEFLRAGRRSTLRIYLDKPAGLTLDDVAAANAWIGPLLDELDPLQGAYTLEVSSPGIDRPLRTIRHFQQAVGEQVQISLHAAAVPELSPEALSATGKGSLSAIGSGGSAATSLAAGAGSSPSACESGSPSATSGSSRAKSGSGLVGKRRKYTGTLLSVCAQSGLIRIDVGGKPVELAHSQISKARVKGRVDFGSGKEV